MFPREAAKRKAPVKDKLISHTNRAIGQTGGAIYEGEFNALIE